MSVLYILILISGLIATAFLIVFIWSVRSGQYDDTYSPSVRMLFNDEVKTADENGADTTDDNTDNKKSEK